MQHLEHDMDDLFKRAAEDYPLQSGEGNWEGIAHQLAGSSDPIVVPPGKNKKWLRIILFCLLLLSFPIYWLIPERPYTKQPAAADVNYRRNETAHSSNAPIIKNIHRTENSHLVSGESNINTAYDKKVVQLPGKIPGRIAMVISGNTPNESNPATSGQREIEDKQATEIPDNDDNLFAGKTETKKKEDQPENRVNLTANISEKGNVQVENLKKNGAITDSPVVANQSKKDKKAGSRRNERLYAGIVAGPDLSKVQAMSFSTAGISAGVVAGYKIHTKLWLETGINWTKKNYKSAGKDFNMDKVRASMTGMVIEKLASQTNLIEIPIKVKYDVISKKKSSFFITGGLSAYIITKEKNKYHVTMNGSQENVIGIYQKNNYRLPAVATMSIGYGHGLNSNLQIRIEPFFKIPLRGVGVGSLPITSTGLQIGIIGKLK